MLSPELRLAGPVDDVLIGGGLAVMSVAVELA
jgi:hypothetical protein